MEPAFSERRVAGPDRRTGADSPLTQLSLLGRLIADASAATSIEAYLPVALDLACEALDFDAGAIYLCDEAHGVATLACSRNVDAEWEEALARVDLDDERFRRLFRSCESVFTEEPGQDDFGRGTGSPYGSAASVPLVADARILGALSLARLAPGAISESQRTLINGVGRELGAVVARLRTVADLRAAEEEARHQAAILEATLDSTADGILVIGLDEHWLVANRRFTEMWEIPPEVVAAGEALEYRGRATEPLRDPEAFARDYERLTKDWSELWSADLEFKDGRVFAAFSRPLLVAGEAAGRLFSFRDITDRRSAEAEAREGRDRLKRMLDGVLEAMGSVVEVRDQYTSGHQRRTAALAAAIGRQMGLPDAAVDGLRMAGEVHDIGQLAVPAAIMTKPGRLSELEFELVRQHPVVGADILSRIEFELPLATIVRQHHERLDGSGYPDGLDGRWILLEARILGVADVVESMSSHRPHRPALGVEPALAEVREHAGTRFDAQVVAACERVFAAGFAFPE